MKLNKYRFETKDNYGIIIEHKKKFSKFTALKQLIKTLKYGTR